MAHEPLNDSQIQSALQDLPGWAYEDDTLRRTFSFNHFREAISFIVRVAFEAEERNHHPEITNVYDQVGIALTTHDADDKVTEADVELAKAIQSFVWV